MDRPDPVAAIDVGTNSVLLTIARPDIDGFDVIAQRATVTRLGQGVDQTGQLHPDAERRTLDCLRQYRGIMDEHGVVRGLAVGTSALRDAEGGEAFLHAASEVIGFPLEVVSGEREAELTFSGALSGLSVGGRALVFDIGGGSTELIIGDRQQSRIESSVSLNVGSVRLTERLALSDPPTAEQRRHLAAAIEQQVAQFDFTPARGLPIVGVAGTVTTLAAILLRMDSYDPARIHGAVVDAGALEELSERLLSMTVAERLTLIGLTKGRADVIGAGAALCSTIVKRTGAPELIVSDRGVRFGLLSELMRMQTPPSA